MYTLDDVGPCLRCDRPVGVYCDPSKGSFGEYGPTLAGDDICDDRPLKDEATAQRFLAIHLGGVHTFWCARTTQRRYLTTRGVHTTWPNSLIMHTQSRNVTLGAWLGSATFEIGREYTFQHPRLGVLRLVTGELLQPLMADTLGQRPWRDVDRAVTRVFGAVLSGLAQMTARDAETTLELLRRARTAVYTRGMTNATRDDCAVFWNVFKSALGEARRRRRNGAPGTS